MAYKQELWNEAKRKCRLGGEEIRMSKEMGLNPTLTDSALRISFCKDNTENDVNLLADALCAAEGSLRKAKI